MRLWEPTERGPEVQCCRAGVCRRLANLIAHTFPAQLAQRRHARPAC